jgi:nucleoside-diphosphate-sugar epimerase
MATKEVPAVSQDDVSVRSVMVLGATGFMGRHICAAFEQTGARVVRVARGVPDDARRPQIRLDLVTAPDAELTRLFAAEAADVVVNASGAVWQVTEPQMWALNAELPRRIAQCLAALGTRPRLVHLGSVHEYGPVPPGERISEGLAPAPVGPYGRTKLLGSQAVLAAARTGALDAVVLRVTNVAGPGSHPGSLLGKIAAHLAVGARAHLAGAPVPELHLAPLRAWRDFVDVRDVADAVVAASLAPVGGQVLNIGQGEAVSVRDLTDRLIRLSNLDVRVVEEPERGSSRSDAPWQQVEIGRARGLLDWRPRRALDQSLADLLAEAVREEGLFDTLPTVC